MKSKLSTQYSLLLFCLLVTACSGTSFSVPTSTPSPTRPLPPTGTLSPTNTVTPTDTPRPTNTTLPPTLTSTPDLPQGTPVSEWQGIPIMPDAIAGDGGETFYKFITKVSQDEVRDYYIETMPKYGWAYEETIPGEPGKYITILPNDKGGFFIYLGGPFDFLYVYEENGYTHVEILYTP